MILLALVLMAERDSFDLCELNRFMIREFPSAGKMYIRVNKAGLFKGTLLALHQDVRRTARNCSCDCWKSNAISIQKA